MIIILLHNILYFIRKHSVVTPLHAFVDYNIHDRQFMPADVYSKYIIKGRRDANVNTKHICLDYNN